jgi:DNA-binding transcriptional MerR regulator
MTNPTPERPRDAAGRYVYTLEAAERDKQAAELRAQGWTLQEIADELGSSHRKNVKLGIQQAFRAIVKGPAEKLLQMEASRLDALYEEALAVLERDHVTVSHGKIITIRDPETGDEKPLLDDGPKLAAIDRLVKIRESYRRLFGLDQPVKVDATVHQVTQQDLELQEMLREAKARTAAEEQQILDGPAEA